MIRSFQGTIRSYHGMIRPFQDTNNRFKLNALYNVIILVRSSFGSRSVLVHPSFILRSSFVRDSCILRSGFVRDSFGIRRTIKEATKMHLRHNGGITKDERSQNDAKTKSKQKESFCLSKRFVLPLKRTPFTVQNDSFLTAKGLHSELGVLNFELFSATPAIKN